MQTAIANRLLTVIIIPPNGYRAVPQKHIHQWIPQLHASTDQHFQLSHMFQDRAALGQYCFFCFPKPHYTEVLAKVP